MSDEQTHRKLAAILSADVKGYSLLMAGDEAATIETLTEHRLLMTEAIVSSGGRVVDSPGDNLLAEFKSALSAVTAAVAIQTELAARNAQAPASRRMEWRIGLNLGDVVADGQRIYGDGVNLAARIEGLADPGGVCLSQSMYDQVKGKFDFRFKFLGERKVKNVDRPIPVWRVTTPHGPDGTVGFARESRGRNRRRSLRRVVNILVVLVAAAILVRAVLRVIDRLTPPAARPQPTIAVLPFNNLSRDKTQDYLADGLTENIITALSKIATLRVIARNSTFVYKGRSVNVKRVGRRLGADYVLEGSVLQAGSRIRVTAQLIDARTGQHLWAEKYDRPLKDVLALQDEITLKIASALMVKLTGGKHSHIGTNNLEAWSLYVRGLGHFRRHTVGDNDQARRLFSQAVKLDPEYALAWVMLAWTYWMDARLGFKANQAKSLDMAQKLAAKALRLDKNLSSAYALWGSIHLMHRRFDAALKSFRRAVMLQPNDDNSLVLYGRGLISAGHPAQAIPYIQRGMALSPHFPAFYLNQLGQAYFLTGRLREARDVFLKYLARCRQGECPPLIGHIFLAGIYAELGQPHLARRQLAAARKINPRLSLDFLRRSMTFKDPALLEKHFQALRKAGLK
jgi:adenylate cyclase